MDTKIVYQPDHLGIYTGKTVADRSPLEPDVWLIPGGCVEVEPPAVPAKKAAFWDGRKWQLVDSYQGLTVYNTTTRAPMVIERAGAQCAQYPLRLRLAGGQPDDDLDLAQVGHADADHPVLRWRPEFFSVDIDEAAEQVADRVTAGLKGWRIARRTEGADGLTISAEKGWPIAFDTT